MKSKKDDEYFVNLEDKLTQIATQPHRGRMKKRPKPFLAFSSFARCNLFSLTKSPPSSVPFSEDNSNSHHRKAMRTKQIESSSDDDEEDEEVALFLILLKPVPARPIKDQFTELY